MAELVRQLGAEGPAPTLVFCSSDYDLARLGPALRAAFPGPLFGCTTAGQIGPGGFRAHGLSALRFDPLFFRVALYPIRPLSMASTRAAQIAEQVRRPPGLSAGAFGFLLIDGLSRAEERVASALHSALPELPIVGGSAGDDLQFAACHLLVEGGFCSDAAMLACIETTLPVRTLKFQHFVPSDTRLVITEAIPDERLVVEINGHPAAQEYARLVGVPRDALDATVFSKNPLLLAIGNDAYVRSIQRVNADDSLRMFCAIERGIVLRLGRGVDPLEALRQGLAPQGDEAEAATILGCDCVLRRLEFEGEGTLDAVASTMARAGVFAFSTYGEQINGLHVNQTFTGVRIGGRLA
ncbi:MAG: FIST N-terminal domain-containing protein [Polyangiales bacterium]